MERFEKSQDIGASPDVRSGRIVLGMLDAPMRNGLREVVLVWEARLLPKRVCEGGGWYSAHPTKRAWQVWYDFEHKAAKPRFDTIASFHATSDLQSQLDAITVQEMRRYGFKDATEKIEPSIPSPTTKEVGE